MLGYRHGYRNDHLSPLRQHRPREERPGSQQRAKQRCLCHACGRRRSRQDPSPNGYTEERKEEILRAYQERWSLRGLRRTFGVLSPTTVISRLKER